MTKELQKYTEDPTKIEVWVSNSIFKQKAVKWVIDPGKTIEDIVHQVAKDIPHVKAFINDREVPRFYFRAVKPRSGTIVSIIGMPAGDDEKGFLGLVAAIALSAAVPALAESSFITKTLGLHGSAALAVSSVIVGFGSQLVMNALIPPPEVPQLPQTTKDEPFNSITGIQNRPNPYGVVPIIFGQVRVYPILISAFTEIYNNEQYFRSLFLIGWEGSSNYLEISDIKLGETAIDQFADVEYEYEAHYSDMSTEMQNRWFPNIVQTTVGTALTNAASWVQQSTETSTTGIIVDVAFPALVQYNENTGDKSAISVRFDVEYKDNADSTWIPFPQAVYDTTTGGSPNNLNTAREGHTATLHGGKIYVIGGSNTTTGTPSYLTSIEEFDPALGTWTTKAGVLSTARRYHAAVSDGTYIYIFGGEVSAGTYTATVERYDPSGDTVSSLTAMPDDRGQFDCFLHDGKVWLYGGYDGTTTFSDLMVYTISGGTWDNTSYRIVSNVIVPKLRGYKAIQYYTGTVTGPNIPFYIMGGKNESGTKQDEIYRLRIINTYFVLRTEETLDQARSDFALSFNSSDSDKIILSGGADASTNESDDVLFIPAFNPKNSTLQSTGISTALSFLASESFNGIVYTIGGLNSAGTAVSTVTSSGNQNFTVTAASTTRVVKSFRVEGLPSSQYDVRIRRTTADTSSNFIQDSATWDVIRSLKASTAVNLSNAKTFVLRAKGLNFSGILDSLNMVVKTHLPVYDGASWQLSQTRNPAYAYAWMLRGDGIKETVPDTEIAVADVKTWGDNCATDSLYYDRIIERETDVISQLQEIAAAGLASFGYKDDQISVIEDRAQSTYRKIFGPANIIKGTFSGSKAYEEVPHAIRARFINSEQDYIDDERIVYRDGYNADGSGGNTIATKIDDMRFTGVTTSDHVYRLARYHLAVGVLRPEVFSFRTTSTHLNVTRGDLVRLNHDAAVIGLASGRIKSVDDDTVNIDEITTDCTATTTAATNYSIRIYANDGDVFEEIVTVASTGENSTFNITTPSNAIGSYTTGDFVLIGAESNEGIDCLVKEIEHSYDLTAEVTLVPYNSAIYNSYTEAIPAYTTVITKTQDIIRGEPPTPTVSSVTSDEFAMIRGAGGSLSPTIQVNITPFSGNQSPPAFIEARAKISTDTDGNFLYSPRDSAENNMVKIPNVEEGADYDVYARYITAEFRAGPWGTMASSHTVVGKSTPPPDVANLTATVQNTNLLLSWDAVTVPDFKEYLIKTGASWAAGTTVARVKTTELTIDALSSGTYNYYIKALDDSVNENESNAEDSVAVTIAALSAPSSLGAQASLGRVRLSWDTPAFSSPRTEHGVRYYNIYRGASGSVFADSVRIGTIEATEYEYIEKSGGTYKYFVTAVDFGGNETAAATYELIVDDAFEYVLIDTVSVTGSTSGTAFKESPFFSPTRYYLGADSVSWVDVHTANGWNSVQDQIDSGNTYFIEPLKSNDTVAGRITLPTISWALGLRNIKARLLYTDTAIDSGTLDLRVRFVTDNGTVMQNQPGNEFFADQVDSITFYVEFYGDSTALTRLESFQVKYWAMKRTMSGTVTVTTAPTGTALDVGGNFTAWPEMTANIIGGSPGDTVQVVQNVAYDKFTLKTYDSGGTQVARTVNWQVRGY